MPVHLVRDADIRAISIVDKGANRKKFFLFKQEGDEPLTDLGLGRLLKASDYSAVYCVVAEPGWHENPGIGAAAPDIDDRWADDGEIRKAAHRFMKNKGLVTKMHESLEPFGELVENAVALDDFTVNGETIRKGSWYIAFEPTPEGKQAIDKGEFAGVSIEGYAIRELVEKADDDHGALDAHLLTETGKIAKAAGKALPGLDKSPKENWVDQAGGLPDLIDRAARHLHSEKGRSISAAIATAVNWAKKGCATGKAFGGKVKVSKPAQARMCAAVAEWEAKKKKAGLKKAKGHPLETAEVVEAYLEKAKGSTPGLRTVGNVEKKLLQKIAEKVGLSAEEVEAINKGGSRTFGEIISQREFDKALPDAFDAFRDAVWGAFFPPVGEDADPVSLISESCDEFKAWALDQLDRVPVEKAERAEALGVDPEGSSAQIRTFKSEDEMGLTETETKRIEKLETEVGEIGTGIKTLLEKADATPEPEAPTVDKVAESVAEVTKSLEGIKADIAKLGEGGSTQTETEETPVAKAEVERVKKAFEKAGVNPALAGVLG